MRVSIGLMLIGCVLLAGCGGDGNKPVANPGTPAAPSGVTPSAGGPLRGPDSPAGGAIGVPPGAGASAGSVAAPAKPAAIESGVAKLTPDNTKIEFVCNHVGANPDPRKGGFAKFAGQAEIDSDGKTLKSVAVVIETASLWTQLPPLTTHLNSPDFFDMREYPEAKFQSTKIAPLNEKGEATITGNLTLLKATKEISFPATVAISGEGLTLKANFNIDRAEFGMDRLQDRVEKTIALTVAIGEQTQPQQGGGGFGPGGPGRAGGRGGPGGGQGGNFDPVAMFKQRDTNGDGKLTGDEIHERMKQDMKSVDTDGDGEISLEEFTARMRQFGGGRQGGGPQGGARPPGNGAAPPAAPAGTPDGAQPK